MSNLDTWNKLSQPPPNALRQIQGGRLKGKTDINPQWRYKAMTEVFGMCGVGWKYEVTSKWADDSASEGEIFAFADINLYIKQGEVWSEPIPGHGGSMLVAKESNGLRPRDEGYKMAIADALSVAMKMLGVGADVYAGLWDGSKYTSQQATAEPKPASGHYCSVHKTTFFKRGNMKSYAHKIEGTDQWCNETPMKDNTKSQNKPPDFDSGAPDDGKTAPPPTGEHKVETEATAYLLKTVVENVQRITSLPTARNYLRSVCKIDNDRIDSEPEAVLEEVKQLQGWE
jgi:hypothetical protein